MNSKQRSKNRLKNTVAAALVGSSLMLGTPAAQSYVLPVIDGASMAQDALNWALDAADPATTLANWITQLQNWKQNLANLVRGQIAKVVGEERISALEERQINQMFEQRKQRCNNISNSVARRYCTRTIELEQEKYGELKKVDKLVQETFNYSINQLVAEQNKTAKSDTGSGVTQTTENAIIAKLQELNARIAQHQNRINALDALITQYRQIRKNLTQNQLKGDSSLSSMLGRAAGTVALQKNAADYRNRAAALRQNSIGISNRF